MAECVSGVCSCMAGYSFDSGTNSCIIGKLQYYIVVKQQKLSLVQAQSASILFLCKQCKVLQKNSRALRKSKLHKCTYSFH